MSQSKWMKGLIVSAIIAVFAGVVGLLASDDSTSASANGDQIREDLIVRPGDLLPDAAQCDSDRFIPNSLPSTEKRWSDAVSTPFASSDKDEMLEELFAEHCGNPTELDMSIQALSQLNVGDFNIGENNPWMGEFLAKAEEKGLRTAFLTLKDGEGNNVFVSAEYQQYAAMTNTILLAFSSVGVQERASVQNWHIEGPVAGELPRTVLNSVQEGLPALVLEYTVKDSCPLKAIGYNVGDKRFEVFPDPVCEAPPEEAPPGDVPPTTGEQPPTTTEKPPRSTTTTVPPGTTVPPTTKPPTTTVPPTTTTIPECGRKSRWDPKVGQCVPNLNGGTTIPPSQSTIVPPTSVAQPAPPPTAPPDPTPPNVTVVDTTPPPVTETPDGNTGVTLPPMPDPPAQPPTPAPPGGGTTPGR